MNAEVESRGLVALQAGGRVPEMLGNFHLDDHNVEEWSDATEPGLRHRARKEVGKWVDPDRNADIQYQKREDSKKSETGQENQRTEVISGTAPDSAFQIVRTHRQVHDRADEAGGGGGSRFSTTSTSYQMSSSRGIRSSSKTTSNKTTTKTVTLSGRSDDFENLKMSFQPLDTSTQRERISMGRSGTLGVRRPPTRRHNPPPPNPTSPSPEPNIDEGDEALPLDNDAHLRNSQNYSGGAQASLLNEPGDYAIVGYKNLSPKIRVGFPVEIQLELQTKLRANSINYGSSVMNGEEARSKSSVVITSSSGDRLETEKRTIMADGINAPQPEPRPLSPEPQPSAAFESSSSQRRKSYGFESFDSHSNQSARAKSPSPAPQPGVGNFLSTEQNNRSIKSLFSNLDNVAYSDRFTPSTLSRSWDLIQNAANSATQAQQRRTSVKRQLFPSSSTTNLVSEPNYLAKPLQNRFEEHDEHESLSRDNYRLDSLEDILSPKPMNMAEEAKQLPDPDSPPSSRSRKLMKMLDESPSILNQIYFKNNLSTESHSAGSKAGAEAKQIDKSETESEWDRSKRQLSFLNDSLSRYLEAGEEKPESESAVPNHLNISSEVQFPFSTRQSSSGEETSFFQKTMGILSSNADALEGYSSIYNNNNDTDLDFNFNSNLLKQTQVSQTWISAGDSQKPSQHARDQDVTTSISATHDPFRKQLKRVEFCKTEVHFTPESGKFHIVETDENKPSTVHLFRRKKRSERKTIEVLRSDIVAEEEGSVGAEHQDVESARVVTRGQSAQSEWSPEVEVDGRTEEARPVNQDVPHEPEIRPSKPFLTPLDDLSDQNRSRINLSLDDEDDSESQLILSNYGELKIQRYLKQLRSSNGSESSEDSLDPDLGPEHEGREGETHFRFENAFHYEHGLPSSFVPLATRRSLIEMNNRNRKRTSHTTTSHVSDNSSTTSNYSLPHSDHSKDYQPLKLTAMEATVATSGSKPKITSVELRYSVEDKEYGKERGGRSKTFMTEPIMVTSRYDDNSQRHHTRLISEDRRSKSSQIPSPVMPTELRSMPPYRNGRHSFNSSPTHSPTRSPSGENPSFRNPPKPPTPILPIQFSTFEKTGAALRERFYTKNPKCVCHGSGDEVKLETRNQATASQNLDSSRNSAAIPSKSFVNIGPCEDDSIGIAVESSKSFPLVLTSSKQHQHHESELLPQNQATDGLENAWKEPGDHYENDESGPKTTSVVRSMTFPKTTRPEPEWVSKAKAKAQSRVTDWTLIGKQYGTNRTSEPPWMSELRIKNKNSPSDELKSLPKVSVVYPWQNDKNLNFNDKDREPDFVVRADTEITSNAQTQETTKTKIRPSRTSTQSNGKLTPFKSIVSESSVSTTNNKSIVDLNRDSDSILINPTQIELDNRETLKAERIRHKRLQSTPSPLPNSINFKRNSEKISQNLNSSESRPMTPTKNEFHRASSAGFNKEKRSKTPENYVEQIPSIRKPLQTSTNTNKLKPLNNSATPTDGSSKSIVGTKPKTPPKPPKPPQRISSLVKSQTTTTFNASLEKKKKPLPTSRKVINHTNNSAESLMDESSRTNTPIHRHPTVQVSKLPIRSGVISKPSSPEGRNTESSKSKTKTHVSLISEAKRLCKVKMVDGSLSSNKTSSSPLSNSPCSGGLSPSPTSNRRTQVIIPAQHKKR